MKAKRRLRWFMLAGMLALGLGLAAGCEGDGDGDDPAEDLVSGDEDGGTVETNVVETTDDDGTVSYITNLVFIPNPITTVSIKLPAPALIGPANGVSWDLVPGAKGATVKFEWEVVAGADSYMLGVKRPGANDFNTTIVAASPRYEAHPRGTNFWKVAAVVDGTPQTWSATRSFIFK